MGHEKAFLHSHPEMEEEHKIPEDHAVVDRNDLNNYFRQINNLRPSGFLSAQEFGDIHNLPGNVIVRENEWLEARAILVLGGEPLTCYLEVRDPVMVLDKRPWRGVITKIRGTVNVTDVLSSVQEQAANESVFSVKDPFSSKEVHGIIRSKLIKGSVDYDKPPS